MLTREAAYPAYNINGYVPGNDWGSKCHTDIHVSLMGVVPNSLTLGHGTVVGY